MANSPVLWGPNSTGLVLPQNGLVGSTGQAVAAGSNISYTPSGFITSTNVQAAISEVAGYSDSNPAMSSVIFDDMTWGNESQTPSGPFGLVPTGVAGGGPVTPANFTGSLVNRWGVFALSIGSNSNSTGNGSMFSDYANMYAGQTSISTLYFSIYTPTIIADSTNDWGLELGFRNSIASAAAANSMCIKYNRATSANWLGYTSNNGTGTTVTSSIAVTAASYWNFKITIQSGTVSFFAATPGNAYSSIGTSTTNLPDSTHMSYMCFIIYKNTSFASARVLGIDYILLNNQFASAR